MLIVGLWRLKDIFCSPGLILDHVITDHLLAAASSQICSHKMEDGGRMRSTTWSRSFRPRFILNTSVRNYRFHNTYYEKGYFKSPNTTKLTSFMGLLRRSFFNFSFIHVIIGLTGVFRAGKSFAVVRCLWMNCLVFSSTSMEDTSDSRRDFYTLEETFLPSIRVTGGTAPPTGY